MSPNTTEEKLEQELADFKQDLDLVKSKIRSVQSELRKLQSELVGYQTEYDSKAEELRRFRMMYPSICKPPTK